MSVPLLHETVSTARFNALDHEECFNERLLMGTPTEEANNHREETHLWINNHCFGHNRCFKQEL